jgi:UDP-glucose 4-epimerase
VTDPVVVTGASGFIGRALVTELARRHQNVMAVARTPQSWPAGVDGTLVKRYADLVLPDHATVIHLAEIRNQGTIKDVNHSAECMALVRSLQAQGPRRFVYTSSAVVYGDTMLHPRLPDEKLSPDGVYAMAKVACEGLALAAGGTVVRLANVYGPGMAKDSVLAEILAQIPGRSPLTIRDGRPVRDFLWIEDAARGLADLALGRVRGVFNLGTSVGTSIADLARLVLRSAGEGRRTIRETHPTEQASSIILDIEMIAGTVGWRPIVTLGDGVARLLRGAL